MSEDSSVNVENAETVNVRPSAMKTPPGAGVASILTPDSAIRKHPLWQAFDRMWRPAGGWAIVSGMAYGFVIGPWISRPMGEFEMVTLAGLMLAMWGLKTAEKITGVA